MPADFYTVLGTAADASEAELRSAYRSRVREFHPDVNDGPDADAQFKLVRKAHDVLSNPVERKTYDRIGHRDYVAKHFDSLPALSVFSHIDESDAPGTAATSASEGSSGESSSTSNASSSGASSSSSTSDGRSRNGSAGATTGEASSAGRNDTGSSGRSTTRTNASSRSTSGQSPSGQSANASRTSRSSGSRSSTRTAQRDGRSSTDGATSSTSRASTASSASSNSSTASSSSGRRSASTSSQNATGSGSSTASATTASSSTRTTRRTSTRESTNARQSGAANEKPSHVGDQVTREEAERNVAERMRANEQTVSAGQRRRRGLRRGYGVVVLSFLVYLGGLGAYAAQHLGTLQTLVGRVTAAPVPTLAAAGSLPSPTTFALSPVAAQTATPGAVLLAGVALLPLVLGTTVARFGRGSAWLYVLGATGPALALAAWWAVPVPLGVAVVAFVVAPVLGAGAFLVDVGRYLSATRT